MNVKRKLTFKLGRDVKTPSAICPSRGLLERTKLTVSTGMSDGTLVKFKPTQETTGSPTKFPKRI